MNKPFNFQTLQGKNISYSDDEQAIIDGLKPLEGGEWEGAIKESSSVLRTNRDALKKSIKAKLEAIQSKYCIYCGLHEEYCGSILQREHIAPKGKAYYPKFVFEPINLVLACHKCNFDLKGEIDIGSGDKDIYINNNFSIVHPYLDNIHDHIELNICNGQAIIRSKNNSKKGLATIRMFQLDSNARTLLRSGLLMNSAITFDSRYDKILQENINRKVL